MCKMTLHINSCDWHYVFQWSAEHQPDLQMQKNVGMPWDYSKQVYLPKDNSHEGSWRVMTWPKLWISCSNLADGCDQTGPCSTGCLVSSLPSSFLPSPSLSHSFLGHEVTKHTWLYCQMSHWRHGSLCTAGRQCLFCVHAVFWQTHLWKSATPTASNITRY